MCIRVSATLRLCLIWWHIVNRLLNQFPLRRKPLCDSYAARGVILSRFSMFSSCRHKGGVRFYYLYLDKKVYKG